ncbi:MAG: hypothetical protein IJY04_10720, partial [Clostridia bacterium]|nr:hypothetical protein [Clostridia bacterium]
MEDHWSTTSAGAGFAGSGYVNNASGNLTFVLNTLATSDSILPTGIQLVYNGYDAGRSVSTFNQGVHTGYGFKLNTYQTLRSMYLDGQQYFVLKDADGTDHYFEWGYYYDGISDMDGLGLTFKYDTYEIRDTLYDEYTIKDKYGNTYYYQPIPDSYSYNYENFILTRYKDVNGNQVSYISNSNYQNTEIRLKPNGSAEFTQLKLIYNDAGLIKRVYNPYTCESYIFLYSADYNGTNLSQENSGYLVKMIYAKGKVDTTESEWNSFVYSPEDIPENYESTITPIAAAVYCYDGSGRLISVRDELQNRELRYTYGNYGRVTSVEEYADGEAGAYVSGQKITFEYSLGTTKIRTSGTDDIHNTDDDLITTYVFDDNSRTATVYTTDLLGTTLYGASSASYIDNNPKAKNKLESYISTQGTHSNYLKNGGFNT